MKSVGVCMLWVVLVVLGLVVPVTRGIWLDVPSSGTKCVSEELHSKVVVLADYFVIGDDHHINNSIVPTISVKVTSPYGNNLHHQENVTHGQFAFTTTESGNYLACFWKDNSHNGGESISVGLEWKTGIAARDWDSVAKKEKIEGLELELQKLEVAVEAIHKNLIYLKDRRIRPKLTLSVFLKITLLAFLEPVLNQNLYYVGLKSTSATFSSTIVNVLPAITFIMAIIFRLEKVNL